MYRRWGARTADRPGRLSLQLEVCRLCGLPFSDMNENRHLTADEFDRLLEHRMLRDELAVAHLHLLKCHTCRMALFAHDDARAGLYLDDFYGAGTASAWRQSDEGLAALEADVVSSTRETLERSPVELSSRDVDGHGDVFAVIPRIERARQLWSEAPESSERILTRVIEALRRRPIDAQFPVVALLLARAHGYRANVYRILDRFDEAAEELTRAQARLEISEAGSAWFGELAWFRGEWCVANRRFDEAIGYLREAASSLPRNGPTTCLQATITLANAYGEAGRHEESIETLRSLVEDFPTNAFPEGAYLATLQSLATGYAETGRAAEARDLLPRIQDLAQEEGKRLNLTRVKWLEALILKAEGKRTPAAMCFREVQADFLAANLAMDAALAGLSHAAMYLEHDDTRAAAELAEELIPVFRSKGIHREAWAASRIVLEALRREAATLAQVEELVDRLRGLPTRRVAR